MSAPQSLLQAAANRLAARFGSGLADTAASLTLLAQDAPARLQQELNLFWQEVEQEAARLDREGMASPQGPADAGSGGGVGRGVWSGFSSGGPSTGPAGSDPQEAIDALRAQVARLAVRLDASATTGRSGSAGNPSGGPTGSSAFQAPGPST
jgi:hypothetical protein